MTRTMALALALTLTAACGPAAKKASQAAPAPAAPLPAGPSTLSAHGSAAPAAPGLGDRASAGLVYTLPAGWKEEAPTSSMRLAQGIIPGAEGQGEFAIYFFGPGGGGGLEANLDRWVGQVEVSAPPQRETFEANGLRITHIDITGTLKPSTMGMGPTAPQPGGKLYGAVVEGPGGPWFIKAMGPEATLVAAREGWLGMLRGVRLQG